MVDNMPTMLPKWLIGHQYTQVSGLSESALKGKRNSGAYLEGLHYKKAPDGKHYYNWRAIDEWVEDGYKQAANWG